MTPSEGRTIAGSLEDVAAGYRKAVGREPTAEELELFRPLWMRAGYDDGDLVWGIVFIFAKQLELLRGALRQCEPLRQELVLWRRWQPFAFGVVMGACLALAGAIWFDWTRTTITEVLTEADGMGALQLMSDPVRLQIRGPIAGSHYLRLNVSECERRAFTLGSGVGNCTSVLEAWWKPYGNGADE